MLLVSLIDLFSNFDLFAIVLDVMDVTIGSKLLALEEKTVLPSIDVQWSVLVMISSFFIESLGEFFVDVTASSRKGLVEILTVLFRPSLIGLNEEIDGEIRSFAGCSTDGVFSNEEDSAEAWLEASLVTSSPGTDFLKLDFSEELVSCEEKRGDFGGKLGIFSSKDDFD